MRSVDYYLGYDLGMTEANHEAFTDRIGAVDFIEGYKHGVAAMAIALREIRRLLR